MIYRLTLKAKKLTLSQWKYLGGCGICDMETANLCQKLKCVPKHLEDKKLWELVEQEPAVGRMLGRYAYERMERKDLGTPADV